MSLELRLPEHRSSAAVYLRWCPRHTGYSVMATPFPLAVLLSPLLGSTVLCPPHSLLAQTLVPPPLDCVALLVTLPPNMVNTATVY